MSYRVQHEESLMGPLVRRILTATEIFYDSDHPDVFVHIQNPGASLTGVAAPNASKVLLLSQSTGVNGYANAGSLYRGSGYWAQGPSLPQALSDLNVSPLELSAVQFSMISMSTTSYYGI